MADFCILYLRDAFEGTVTMPSKVTEQNQGATFRGPKRVKKMLLTVLTSRYELRFATKQERVNECSVCYGEQNEDTPANMNTKHRTFPLLLASVLKNVSRPSQLPEG